MAALDPARPLTATTGNLRRRQIVDRVMRSLSTAAAVLAVVVLGIVVYTVAKRGASAISVDFFTKNGELFGAGGGIGEAIIGTLLIVAVAAVMAVPIGVLIAIYLTEFASPRTAGPIRLAVDLLNGLPSIVIGVFVFGLLVAGHHQSGFAGSFALAIIMVPLVCRSTQEVLLLVPNSLREAGNALGVSRWRTVLGVILPNAIGGILTGSVLAVARAAGETAPMILVCSIFAPNVTTFNFFGGAIPNIPTLIFQLSEEGTPAAHAEAWGAALTLMAMILIASIIARALFARSRAKLTG